MPQRPAGNNNIRAFVGTGAFRRDFKFRSDNRREYEIGARRVIIFIKIIYKSIIRVIFTIRHGQ